MEITIPVWEVKALDCDVDGEIEWVREGDEITIGSEFALATVRKVLSRNGERLEVLAPKMGVSIRLDALLLEALAGHTTRSLSVLLKDAGSAR